MSWRLSVSICLQNHHTITSCQKIKCNWNLYSTTSLYKQKTTFFIFELDSVGRLLFIYVTNFRISLEIVVTMLINLWGSTRILSIKMLVIESGKHILAYSSGYPNYMGSCGSLSYILHIFIYERFYRKLLPKLPFSFIFVLILYLIFKMHIICFN